jgi:hypothetical protein
VLHKKLSNSSLVSTSQLTTRSFMMLLLQTLLLLSFKWQISLFTIVSTDRYNCLSSVQWILYSILCVQFQYSSALLLICNKMYGTMSGFRWTFRCVLWTKWYTAKTLFWNFGSLLWRILSHPLFEEATVEFLNKSLQNFQKNYQSKKSLKYIFRVRHALKWLLDNLFI